MTQYLKFAHLLDHYLTMQDRSGAWLAQRLAVNAATVTRWRNGDSRPNKPEVVIQVADLLGIYGEDRQRLLVAAGYGVVDGDRERAAHDSVPAPSTVGAMPLAKPTSRWATYPATYRQAEMATLAQWMAIGASGIVLGIAGSGVSSLLRYFVYRPELLPGYLPGPVRVLPVWLELQSIGGAIPATIYRLFLHGIGEMAQRVEHPLAAALLQTCQTHLNVTDPFTLQTALFGLLAACEAAQVRLVFVWDRLDPLEGTLRRELGNCLRMIRDSFPETVIYLMGMRYTPTCLDEIDALDALGRLLSSHLCLVGRFTQQDSDFVIETRTESAPIPPTAAEGERFCQLSGGYPTLLKAVIRWWLTQAPPPPPATWLTLLLPEPGIQLRLRAIWRALSTEEQAELRRWFISQQMATATGAPPVAMDEAIGLRLSQLGICYRDQGGWHLTGTLLAGLLWDDASKPIDSVA